MDYLQTLEQLQDYYSNLLIIQYNGKPKAKATIELLTRLVYSNMALLQIRDAFDWKTAKEAQLDIIGKWEGIDKAYTKNDTWTNTYLSYPNYGTFTDAEDDPQRGGYSDYSNFDTLEGGVLTYKDLQANKQELDPEQYRIAIGLKIIKNHIVHNQGNIDEAIWKYFGGNTYYSEGDVQVDDYLYLDEKCTQKFGKVSDISGSIIEVTDDDNKVIFSGYFNYYLENDIYYYNLGHIYTTWDAPHVVTYHYPLDMTEIINMCYYKNVLLAPTGVSILLTSY